jgi:hypothetical protein
MSHPAAKFAIALGFTEVVVGFFNDFAIKLDVSLV